LFINVLMWRSTVPELRVEAVHRWPRRPTPTQLKSTLRKLALDPRYFRTCARCRRFTLAGWFNHGRTCDYCMERFYGTIH